MVVLEVGIDARGMVTGSQQAFSALGQLTMGIGQLTTSLKTAQGGIAVLGNALLTVQPWVVAITAVLSGANMAWNLFGSETEKAARSLDKVTEALRAAKGELAAATALGAESFASASRSKSVQSLFQIGLDQYRDGQYFPTSLGQLTDRLGESRDWMLEQVARLGDAGIPLDRSGTTRFGQSLLTEAQFVAILQGRAQEFGGFANPGAGLYDYASMEPMQHPGMDPFGTGSYASRTAGFLREDMRGVASAEAQAASMRKEMEALNQQAQQLGQYLGDAAFDFVAGLRDGREVLASMAMDFGRILMRQAMTQAAQWAFGATR